MSDANNNVEAQPNTQTQITEAIAELTGLVESVRDQLTALAKVSVSKDEAEEIVHTTLHRELEGYDKTDDILKKVDSRNATLNRSMSDGFKSLETKLGEFMSWTREKLTDHGNKIGHNVDEIEIVKVKLDQYRENQARNTANIEQLLEIATRLENAVRGETNGLVVQLATTQIGVKHIAEDQSVMQSELVRLTQITGDNARLYQELAKREDAREQAREQRYKTLWKWGIRLARVAGVLVTGGGGVAAIDLLGRLIGG